MINAGDAQILQVTEESTEESTILSLSLSVDLVVLIVSCLTHDAHCLLSSKLWRKNLELGTLLEEDQLVGGGFCCRAGGAFNLGGGGSAAWGGRGEMLMICKKLQRRTGCIDWLHGWGRWCRLRQSLFICLMEMWAGLWNTRMIARCTVEDWSLLKSR
jgi:hypothetical protein